MTPDQEILSFRTIAVLPVVLFAPTLILGVVMPGSAIGTALGMLFHLRAVPRQQDACA